LLTSRPLHQLLQTWSSTKTLVITSRAGIELSRNLPAIFHFHNLMMIPLYVSTFHWQFTTRASS